DGRGIRRVARNQRRPLDLVRVEFRDPPLCKSNRILRGQLPSELRTLFRRRAEEFEEAIREEVDVRVGNHSGATSAEASSNVTCRYSFFGQPVNRLRRQSGHLLEV